MKTISIAEYHEMENLSMGFCKECQEFTRDCTEPDAEDYDCPDCGSNSVVGTMNAHMDGLIEVEE